MNTNTDQHSHKSESHSASVVSASSVTASSASSSAAAASAPSNRSAKSVSTARAQAQGKNAPSAAERAVGRRDRDSDAVRSLARSSSSHSSSPPSSSLLPPLRTLDDVRNQVAREIAVRAITNAESVDGVRIGVTFTLSTADDERFLHTVADIIQHRLTLSEHLFIISTSGGSSTPSSTLDTPISPTHRGYPYPYPSAPGDVSRVNNAGQFTFPQAPLLPTRSTNPDANMLIILGSSQDCVQRATLLASSKFLGRLTPLPSTLSAIDKTSTSLSNPHRFLAYVSDAFESARPSRAQNRAAQRRGARAAAAPAGPETEGYNDTYDAAALLDIVRKAAKAPIDPLLPPPGSKGIDQMLAEARAKLQRLTPLEAFEELRGDGASAFGNDYDTADAYDEHDEMYGPPDGHDRRRSARGHAADVVVSSAVNAPCFLVDIRPERQRAQQGGIRGALCIERNVLEWRFDPRSDARLPIVDRYDLRVIVFCSEGYTSSLAALALQQLGLLNATDVVGGFKAWKEAGLPVEDPVPPPPPRSLVSLAGAIV